MSAQERFDSNGVDWEEVLRQRAIEITQFRQLGLLPPKNGPSGAPAVSS